MKAIVTGNLVAAPELKDNKNKDLGYVTAVVAENQRGDNTKTDYIDIVAFNVDDSAAELLVLNKGQLVRIEGVLDVSLKMNPDKNKVSLNKTIKYISKIAALNKATNKMETVYEKKKEE